MQAFRDLNETRQAGNIELPFLVTEIEAYARIHGFSGEDEMLFFYRAMKELDKVYLAFIRDKREKEREMRKKQPTRPRRFR